MKIHEYQAKAILGRYAVPVPRGKVAFTADEAESAARELGGSVVVKASDNLTTDTLVEALESIQNLDIGIGAKISYGPSEHQGSHKVWGTVLDKTVHYQILDLE